MLAADQHPDHDSVATFRQRHLPALASLFVQVLELCRAAGLVTLGHVALDGTKIKANASKHKAMSYARMQETEQRLEQEVQALLRYDALHPERRRHHRPRFMASADLPRLFTAVGNHYADRLLAELAGCWKSRLWTPG